MEIIDLPPGLVGRWNHLEAQLIAERPLQRAFCPGDADWSRIDAILGVQGMAAGSFREVALNTGDAALALAVAECEAIRQALGNREDAGESIHETRKGIRRLRALLAMARKRADGLAAVDRSLERLGEGLSSLRDAHVVVAATQRMASSRDAAHWQPVAESLVRRRDSLLALEQAADPGFARRRRTVTRIERVLRGADWTALRKKDLRAALERSQRRVQEAGKCAEGAPTADNLHRWRRRVRRLRMQLEAARVLAPGSAKSVARQSLRKELDTLHELGESLGWHQDLQVLSRMLARMRNTAERPLLSKQLQAEIESSARGRL